jgi:hypothetical protein
MLQQQEQDLDGCSWRSTFSAPRRSSAAPTSTSNAPNRNDLGPLVMAEP